MQKKLSIIITLVFLFAISACGVLSEKIDETKNWSDEKLYSEARSELASGNYDQAIKLFEKVEGRYPFGTYAQQSQMEIAYAYYRQGERPQALAAAERFIKLHPDHAHVDYMYYLRGLINFNGDLSIFNFLYPQDPTERDPRATREAFEAFKQLVDRFPSSKYVPDSVARMNYLINAMAQYDVHVARYYFRRGAYLAAVNRAQSAVNEYRAAPAIEEALFIMVNGYDKLGLVDLRDDASRVFKTNFPNSKFLKNGGKSDEPWWKIF